MGPALQSRRTWPTGLRWLVPWLALACAVAALAQPAAPANRESAVKAAFLYKFAAFVEWPAGTFARADVPLVIGVLGDEAVAADLEQIVAGRTLDGRPVAVRRLREGEPAEDLHILLLGPGREPRVRELAAAVPGAVLVVTEQDNGLRLGGVLNFSTDAGRVRFSASPAAADARGLRLSARLLAVAKAVEGRAR